MNDAITKPMTKVTSFQKDLPGLQGTIQVPGDKSISHRSLMMAAVATGQSHISGLLEGHDVLATARALRALGVHITKDSSGVWHVAGRGAHGLSEPAEILDMGNSGTGMRLLMGLLAGHPLRCFLSGDESLNRRPMRRISDPLGQMGAQFTLRQEEFPPLMMEGTYPLMPVRYQLPKPSAQIKSAILLAGMNSLGRTEIIEPTATRDHTERLLIGMGAQLDIAPNPDGPGKCISLHGPTDLKAQEFDIPGDFSAAAFFIVAASLVPGSKLHIKNIGINPTRCGLLNALDQMGACVSMTNRRTRTGEQVADFTIEAAPMLRAITLGPEHTADMIDEYPILSVAAAFAEGTSRFEGLSELRVKESDRLAAIENGLLANGVTVRTGDDWIEIDGGSNAETGGGLVKTEMDHRIAMSFLVMGLASAKPVTIDHDEMIATSFPDFHRCLEGIGARLSNPEDSANSQAACPA